MEIIISNSSTVPIYEQVKHSITEQILDNTLKENEMLPSIRSLAKDLNISIMTVKKAYDYLESEGFVVTVHGKGTYVAASNSEIQEEEQRKEVELDIEMAVKKARRYGISDEDIKSIFSFVIDEN